jgi:transcriptional regulator
MYVPRQFEVADFAEIRAMVAGVGVAQLITVGPSGYPLSTLLPILWRDNRVVAHFARANPHWQSIAAGSPALLVVTGPDAYVSPSWYASKAEHGRVVPTWNYSTVHLAGRATVHDSPDWVRSVVTDLTAAHEAGRQSPWAVTDAPPKYVDGQLKAIIGVEIVIESVEAKAKLSQNRSEADRAGVIAGLGDHPLADAMRRSVDL